MITKDEIQLILNCIEYKPGWNLRLLDKGDGYLVQVTFLAKDIHTQEDEMQYCRKYYVSPHSCRSEIIRGVHQAIQQAELHEMNETFKYNGVAIFDPHTDLDLVASLFVTGHIQTESRTPKPTK